MFILSNHRGNTLIGVLVASAIGTIIMMSIVELTRIATKNQASMSSKVDLNILIDDIHTTLSNPSLCQSRFGNIQGTADLNTEFLRMKLSSGEELSQNTSLNSYNLTNVSFFAKSSQKLASDPQTGLQTLLMNIALQSSKKTGEINRERTLGSVFLLTDAKGKITGCSLESMSGLVECPSGQVQISQGPNTLPTCDTMENLIKKAVSSICPTGQVLVSAGASGPATCTSLPASATPIAPPAPIIIAAAAPAPPPVAPAAPSAPVCYCSKNQKGNQDVVLTQDTDISGAYTFNCPPLPTRYEDGCNTVTRVIDNQWIDTVSGVKTHHCQYRQITLIYDQICN